MPGRNLRSTRKNKQQQDYLKLHEGPALPGDDDEEISPPALVLPKKMSKKQKKVMKQQQQQQKKTASAPSSSKTSPIVGDEISSSHDTSDDDVKTNDESARSTDDNNNNNKTASHYKSSDHDGGESDEDVVMRKAKEKLARLRKKEERVRREEKLFQIEEETKRLEKSLKKKQQTGHRSKKGKSQQTTNADLRSMNDVVARVDTLMSEKKLNFKDTSDSELEVSNDSSVSDVNCGDSSASERETQRSTRKKEYDQHDEKGRGSKKSGKEQKLTSNIKYPQKWPHSFLKLHYVAKEKKYDDLTLAEFCAGYLAILKICKSSHKKARIDHLEELMYHATTKPWKSVLNYHAACLLEIERGDLKWGANFQLHGLHNTILTGAPANANPRNANPKQPPQSNSGSDERVIFCKSYQRGTCNFTRDHYGQFMGESQLLRHICAKCWLAGKKQSPHPEQSDACPLSKVDF